MNERQFVPETRQNDQLLLDASAVSDAASVRFCRADSPICNLCNIGDLPAVPFGMPLQ